MELGEWLSRGLSLTWRYKSLWLFGVLAALGTGAPRLSGNFNFSFRTSMPPQPWPPASRRPCAGGWIRTGLSCCS
jgi:hypothetical protein